uniref:Alpha N-terminal protein methyltransferase 1 n=1 Tax=Clastoptera arizonana TaxID=38151 RepID=A0A1B6CFI2_9HEMI
MNQEETINVENNHDLNKFYRDAISYWSNIPPTVDGMLAGFAHISDVDIKGSGQFLETLFKEKNPPGHERALDCGAGIGRITKHLLLKHFNTVDLVEQNKTFLDESPTYIGDSEKIGSFFNVGLQDFKPSKNYDVIWCQWVLVHLTDDDLIKFFKICKMDL